MIEIFRRVRNPSVIEIPASHSVHVMASAIVTEINEKLGKNYPMPRTQFPTLRRRQSNRYNRLFINDNP